MTTTKTSCTPGPWEVNRRGEQITVDGQNGVCILDENGSEEANARLIAASPNMLTALKAILTLTARHGGTENDAEAIAAIEQLAAVAVRDAEGR